MPRPRTSASAVPTEAFPCPKGIVVDRAGLAVDCTGWTWSLNDPGDAERHINWHLLRGMRHEILDATADYVVSLIQTHAPSYSQTAVVALSRAMRRTGTFPRACGPDGGVIGLEIFVELRDLGGSLTPLHHWRMFYAWCAARHRAGFDPVVAERLEGLVIGNDPKGLAVLSADPDKGPLTDEETALLASALRAADQRGLLTVRESAAAWLFLAFGPNPLNMCLLREEDFERLADPATGAVMHQISVPRIKKRLDRHRTAFKVRKLNPEIGHRVALLVAENQRRRVSEGWPDPAFAFPLFRADRPREAVAQSENREYAMHMDVQDVAALLTEAIAKLDVTSPRTGGPLSVGPRRLRYTFLTRLIREGVSLRAAAEAADHSDTQTVMTYVNLRGDLVEKLDEAIAIDLAARAQAFMGMLVRGEADAVRGEAGAASRVYHAGCGTGSLSPVGTCGSFGFCGLAAPLACYECTRFQPWMDGPHEEVLRALLTKRETMVAEETAPGQIRTLDRTVLAVADVVRRISSHKGARAV